MANRLDQLGSLVTQYLRAESEVDLGKQNDAHDKYQWMLRAYEVTEDDIDWINREIARRKIGHLGNSPQADIGNLRDLPVADIIHAWLKTTPMSRLYPVISKVRDWSSNDRDEIKAYLMACFSEIAYLHLTDYELSERDRYKIFSPKLTHSYLRDGGPRFDLIAVMARVADIRIKIIETRRFVYLIAPLGNFVVVAIRGTVGWRDWLLDLEALKNPAPYGFYHRGFHDEAKIALPLLLPHVEDRRPLYITGHSLGGGVASILSKIWPAPAPQTPYVFASPRFGTRSVSRRRARYAYVRPADLVPHLPPRFLGYSDEGAHIEVLPAEESMRSGWSVFRGGMLAGFDFAQPHSMAGHRKLLGTPIGEPFDERSYIASLMAI